MFDFLLQSHNLPFTVALGIMSAIAILEGTAMFMGAGLSSFIDSMLPDLDLDLDFDVGDADIAEISHPGALTKFWGWLRIGKVPVLMLLVIFMLGFGLSGLILQSAFYNIIGIVLPWWLAVMPAGFVGIGTMRIFGGLLDRYMPKDETEAVSSASFIGRVGVITSGVSKKGIPAQAKLKDEHGKRHYVMVEPDLEEESFSAGNRVLLIKKETGRFLVIRPKNKNLVNN